MNLKKILYILLFTVCVCSSAFSANMRKFELVTTCTLANTQYTITLPDYTVSYTLKARTLSGGQYDFRVAGTTGKVATPTEPYWLVEAGGTYWEGPSLQLIGNVLYVASSQAGLVIQCTGYTTKAA